MDPKFPPKTSRKYPPAISAGNVTLLHFKITGCAALAPSEGEGEVGAGRAASASAKETPAPNPAPFSKWYGASKSAAPRTPANKTQREFLILSDCTTLKARRGNNFVPRVQLHDAHSLG